VTDKSSGEFRGSGTMEGDGSKRRMTLQEAIMDPDRPLSVPPQEWILHEEAKEHEEEDVFDAAEIVREQGANPEDASAGGMVPAEERFEIGVEQMVLGCRIAIRALQEISRKDLGTEERGYWSDCERLVYHAVAPYLADILVRRKRRIAAELKAADEGAAARRRQPAKANGEGNGIKRKG